MYLIALQLQLLQQRKSHRRELPAHTERGWSKGATVRGRVRVRVGIRGGEGGEKGRGEGEGTLPGQLLGGHQHCGGRQPAVGAAIAPVLLLVPLLLLLLPSLGGRVLRGDKREGLCQCQCLCQVDAEYLLQHGQQVGQGLAAARLGRQDRVSACNGTTDEDEEGRGANERSRVVRSGQVNLELRLGTP